jgi:beta-glucanase (GH16 family)
MHAMCLRWRIEAMNQIVSGWAALSVAVAGLSALSGAAAADPPADRPAPTWADEFEAPGAPDSANWEYETGFVRNKEAQFYARERLENARVEGGHLVITAVKEPWREQGKEAAYTSASLVTRGRREFRYGRLEVRAKLPEGRGIWPAIWLLGTDKSKGWPACGEIDLMEYVGFDPHSLHFNIHTPAYNHVKKTNKGRKVMVQDAAHDWHIYALEWHPDRLEFFLDGAGVFTFKNEGTGPAAWPFDKPHYLLLNVAVGGGWGGAKGIDDTIFPQRMLVDYVRYWEAKE